MLEGTAERAPGGRAAGAYVLVDEDGERPRPRADRHRIGGLGVRRRRATCSPATASRRGSCRCRRGTCSTQQTDDVPRRGAPARRAHARGRGGRELRMGALRRRRRRPSTASVRPRRASTVMRRARVSPPSTSPNARVPCWRCDRPAAARRGGPHDSRDRAAQRVRAEPVVRQPRPPLLPTAACSRLVDDDGIRGVTSNPTIFEKAMAAGDGLRRGACAACAADGLAIEDTYWDSSSTTSAHAADVLRPCYDASTGPTASCRSRCRPTSRTTPTGRSRRPRSCSPGSAART